MSLCQHDQSFILPWTCLELENSDVYVHSSWQVCNLQTSKLVQTTVEMFLTLQWRIFERFMGENKRICIVLLCIRGPWQAFLALDHQQVAVTNCLPEVTHHIGFDICGAFVLATKGLSIGGGSIIYTRDSIDFQR